MDQNFVALLSELMSTDNNVRQKAEAVFEQIPPQQKLGFLMSSYSVNQSEESRLLSMVLLRRLITSECDKFYPNLTPEEQVMLKSHLLSSIQSEQTSQVRNRICDCASELARNLTDETTGVVAWPEIQDAIFAWAANPSEALREAAMHIFADFPSVFGKENPRIEVIMQMLQVLMSPPNSIKVRTEAAKATTAFLQSPIMDTPEKQAHFSPLIPLIIQLLVDMKADPIDDAVLQSLAELCEQSPKLVRPHLGPLLDIMMAYLVDEETLESWQNLCLEVIVTLCESAPAMMRKLGSNHINALIPIIVKMMADIEEDSSWDTNDNGDSDEYEPDCPSVVGESSVDRLAIALGGKQILPRMLQVITPMLNSTNWKERHAGLMAISAMGEGCRKQMQASLEQIVSGVLNFLGDSHPRVRYAAINCLGQMANDFAPNFEKKFHATVLPGLCTLLVDNSHPRVQAHAGAALVNFFEECPKKIMVQYLPNVAPSLAQILTEKMNELATSGVKLVLEQVLVTTSALADSCASDFVVYYDQFVPAIKYIIEHANTKELEVLKGKAIECISLIALAVGKERFAADAEAVMDLLIKGQNLPEDSQLLSYMIYGWMRLCKILGKDFERFLPIVMPTVLRTAAMKPQMTVMDNDEVPDETGEDWTFVGFGDHKTFGIRTAGLEEKATAFEMLLCYAKELKTSFGPHVEEVLKLCVSTLKFYFHEGVRISAAGCIPELLSCAQVNNMDVASMWAYVAPELLSAIAEETDNEVLPDYVDSLALCVGVVGLEGLNEALVKQMMELVQRFLKLHFMRDEQRHDRRKDEDYDEDVEDQLQQEGEEDNYLLTKTEELIRQLCKSSKESMIPFLDEVVPHFGRLIQPDRPIGDIQWALCFYDDVTECVGETAAVRYKDVFADKLVDYCGHPDSAEIRQAASYGIGILARYGGEQMIGYIARSLPILVTVINGPESRIPDNVVATENAISAVAKVIMYRPTAVPNIDELIGLFCRWLPITEDDEEIGPCFELVCTLMESNNAAFLGPNQENLPHVVKCIAEVFGCKSVSKDSEVGARMIRLLKSLQTNAEVFSACASTLNAAQQEVLQSILA